MARITHQSFHLNGHDFVLESMFGYDFKGLLKPSCLKTFTGAGPHQIKPEFKVHDDETLAFLKHYMTSRKFFPEDFISERDFCQGSTQETLFLKIEKSFEAVGILRTYSGAFQRSRDEYIPGREIQWLARAPQSPSGVCLQNKGIGELLVTLAEGWATQFREKIVFLTTSDKGTFLYRRLGYKKMYHTGSTYYKFLSLGLLFVAGFFSGKAWNETK